MNKYDKRNKWAYQMTDPDDWNYFEEYGGAKALVYGWLIAWAVLIIGGCSWVLWRAL